MAKKSPPLIELVGYPGSGKSSVARIVLEELRKTGLRAESEDEDCTGNAPEGITRRIGRRVKHVFQFPRLTGRAYKFALTTGIEPWSAFRAAGRLSNLAVRVERSWDRDCDVLISDELFIHGLFSFWFGRVEKPEEKHVEDMVGAIYSGRPHVLVYLDVPRNVCRERFSSRAGSMSRFNSETREKMSQRFLNDRNYEIVLGCYERATGRNVVKVDAREGVASVAEAVFEVAYGAIPRDTSRGKCNGV